MTARTIAVGDIHGCLLAFDRLLEALTLHSEDTLIVLGDMVDRGPDSRGVIERVLELRERHRVIALRGNHEQMMLDSFEDETQREFWLQCGGSATINSYGGALDSVPEAHRTFLQSTIIVWECPTHFFIHANYVADLPLSQQPLRVALWEHLTHLVPPPHVSGKCAVVGHTPQRDGEVLDLGHIICLDTYCVGGGWLTAMDVGTGRTWQAHRTGELRRLEPKS